MQFRDQVAGSDIDKAARGKRQKEGGKIRCPAGKIISYYCAGDAGQRGKKIIKQGLEFAEAAVDQHAEIAELLRYLVANDYEGGNQAEPDVNREAGADDKAVNQIVDAVADEI